MPDANTQATGHSAAQMQQMVDSAFRRRMGGIAMRACRLCAATFRVARDEWREWREKFECGRCYLDGEWFTINELTN